jgi:HAD superfamily hydrolase (TIGR01509 family)
MPTIELILFDCDGVLVDSEILACRVVSECLRDQDIFMPTTEVIRRYMGLSNKSMMLDLTTTFEGAIPKTFAQYISARTAEAFELELQCTPGIKEVLTSLSTQICVASSSSPERIKRSLTLTGLIDYFGRHIFSATQVEQGKPAPDLFLFAAASMAASPECCVVIEDSIPGVIAARSAHMQVFGFTGGSHCTPDHGEKLLAAGAAITFQRMSDLPGLLLSHSLLDSK